MQDNCGQASWQETAHACSQKVLQGDGSSGEELLQSGSEFERWIKLGLNSIEESQGAVAEG